MTAPEPDDPVVVLSEERARVDTVRVPTVRVRLRKRIVTETRTVTVQVRREVFDVVEDPLPASDGAPAGGDGPATDWLVLCEEEITVTTSVRPVERVRLVRHTVHQQRELVVDVAKERIRVESLPPHPPGAAHGR